MLIIPAIDIKDGKVVRLTQGKFDHQKVYADDPAEVAKRWATLGAQFLHIVDLDGAKAACLKNLEALKKIIRQVGIPLEFGGGVRDTGTIRTLASLGVSRIVLGTKAAMDRSFLEAAFDEFKERIIVSIDAKDGLVLVEGWQSASGGRKVFDFARELKSLGFKQVIYTDITKDGMLCGPNLEGIKQLHKESGLQVIASGGVSSLKDLEDLKFLAGQAVVGVIVGKALYENKFTLPEALKIV